MKLLNITLFLSSIVAIHAAAISTSSTSSSISTSSTSTSISKTLPTTTPTGSNTDPNDPGFVITSPVENSVLVQNVPNKITWGTVPSQFTGPKLEIQILSGKDPKTLQVAASVKSGISKTLTQDTFSVPSNLPAGTYSIRIGAEPQWAYMGNLKINGQSTTD